MTKGPGSMFSGSKKEVLPIEEEGGTGFVGYRAGKRGRMWSGFWKCSSSAPRRSHMRRQV